MSRGEIGLRLFESGQDTWPMSELRTLSDIQLHKELATVLENWPLYREFKYTGATSESLPDRIRLFCDRCKNMQQWQKEHYPYSEKAGFHGKTYTCRNCGQAQQQYFYYWKGNAS